MGGYFYVRWRLYPFFWSAVLEAGARFWRLEVLVQMVVLGIFIGYLYMYGRYNMVVLGIYK
jgi:hypothetical protein